MSDSAAPSKVRIAVAALLITGVVNTLFYARLIVLGYPLDPGYPAAFRDLQQAMTWADGWMGIMAIVAAIGIRRGRGWGRLCGIAAAGGLVHMGWIDIAFMSQHGMYAEFSTRMIEHILIDVWAFGVGGWLIWNV